MPYWLRWLLVPPSMMAGGVFAAWAVFLAWQRLSGLPENDPVWTRSVLTLAAFSIGATLAGSVLAVRWRPMIALAAGCMVAFVAMRIEAWPVGARLACSLLLFAPALWIAWRVREEVL